MCNNYIPILSEKARYRDPKKLASNSHVIHAVALGISPPNVTHRGKGAVVDDVLSRTKQNCASRKQCGTETYNRFEARNP